MTARALFLLALLLLPVARAPAQEVDFRSRPDAITFNRFSILRQPDPAEGENMGRLAVLHDGQPLYTGDPVRLDLTAVGVRLDQPAAGLATLMVTTFDGGAHCCFETSLLTVGQGQEECARVHLAHGPEPVATDDGQDLVILDWTFAYYDAAAGGVSFSFAASPAMKRRLVRDARGWRVDAPGEFPFFYKELLAPLERQVGRVPLPVPRDNGSLAALMQVAYYRIMAGEEEKTVLTRWRRALSGRSLRALDAVFADVVKAAREFNPVTRQALPVAP